MIEDNYKKYDNAISVIIFFIKRILQCNLGMILLSVLLAIMSIGLVKNQENNYFNEFLNVFIQGTTYFNMYVVVPAIIALLLIQIFRKKTKNKQVNLKIHFLLLWITIVLVLFLSLVTFIIISRLH
ncbi:hypothetical protein [Flavobacterium sp.]|uniref:hypothetical protein n=1 Tax=Flavobacterium sp. TaxID=239 RepID=UPI004048D50B